MFIFGILSVSCEYRPVTIIMIVARSRAQKYNNGHANNQKSEEICIPPHAVRVTLYVRSVDRE
jgi:hypothetical protein